MRQVYTSPRLENVEAVAKLLQQHEIETRIVNGRSYRGGIRGDFSYRQRPERGEEPSVWVVRSEDRPRARELLRGEGLVEDSRRAESYLPELSFAKQQNAPRRRFGLRTLLLVAAAFGIGLAIFGRRAAVPTPDDSGAVDNAVASTAAAGIADDGTYLVETPSALAAMLIDVELQAQGAKEACLSVDGKAPTPKMLELLRNPAGVRLRPASGCPSTAGASTAGAATPATSTSAAVSITVRDYRTDGSGKGTVQLEIVDVAADGARRTDTRTLEVRRVELAWEVTGVRM